ncbi:hypothetical protein ACNOYE_20220 [Nannocystaceae bacterium ST9]
MRPGLAALVVFGAIGCVRPAEPHGDVSVREPLDPPDANAARSEPENSQDPRPEPPTPRLLITEPAVMVALERELALPTLIGEAPLEAIAASLDRRLASDRAEDPEHTGVGLRHVHRQFDLRWLAAPDTRFELIGVVNRMDRHVFDPGAGLGETRLIYRLAYTRTQKGLTVDSRLPMTINVVFWQRPDAAMPSDDQRLASLRELAGRWQAEPALEGEALAEWLRAPGRPLAPERLDRALIKSVEIDVQTERWPSTIRPDMAGHAEYLLQVFEPDGEGRWQPAPLENTPDVERLARDRVAKAELLAWLEDPAQRAALAEGTLVMPERFSARAATSVTPRGLARQANRPWSQLFDADDFTRIEFDERLGSGAALLRRLDGMSCQGCHESRSVAGFHLLGEERDAGKTVDALHRPSSPHLDGELERRAAWFAAVVAGEAPSEVREPSEHELARGSWGSRCGLGDPGFAAWTCDEGLVCTALSDPELGTCLEPEPGGVGGVCEVGRIKPSPDQHRDRIVDVAARACGEGGVCNDDRVGFPEGMCAFACADERPEGECGAIPNLRGFNDCLARDQPFATCIAETGNPAALRACDAEAPCRDDYICARSGSSRGVCLPPYFLFQLRVDGHPS